MELYLLEKRVKNIVQVLGVEWLKTYGYPNFDNTVYPNLWRREDGQHYLMYTVTDIVPLSQGPWTHVIACGPTATCVLSLQGNGQPAKVRYFKHTYILDVKKYHYEQRRQVQENAERKAIIKVSHLSNRKIEELLAQARQTGDSERLKTLEAIFAEREAQQEVKQALKQELQEARKEKEKDKQLITELLERLREENAKLKAGHERKLVMYRTPKPIQPPDEEPTSQTEESAQVMNEDMVQLPPPRKRKSRFSSNHEGHQVNMILHYETREIADYLAPMPGIAIPLHMRKKPYPREDTDRKGFNQQLSRWPESRFRELLYKLLLVGFKVQTEPFDLQALATCPYCNTEVGGKWQDLIIVKGQRSIKCSNCGANPNITLAMAMTSLQVKEETKAA